MSNLVKNLLIALALAAVLFFGYTHFFGDDDAALSVSGPAATVSAEAAADLQRFQSELASLQQIKLRTEIFTDERFVSLFDFRQSIQDVPTGRTNPFAPVF